MPRLSLYKPEKGFDYKFVDRQASEMFQVGGTDCYIHKYLGPATKTSGTMDQPAYNTVSYTNIQDLLFLENRDTLFDNQIYRIRVLYNVQNIDFNLSQFGLFIDNDTLYATVHINDFVKTLGRKPMSGDVMELPHLRDDFALNDFSYSLPRYYVIEDVGRAAEGFSQTWFPHLYRLKLKRVTDNQKFAGLFNGPVYDSNNDPIPNTTLRDLLSTYNSEIAINNRIVQQAETDSPQSGYETRQFYTLAVDLNGKPIIQTADEVELDASQLGTLSNANDGVPLRTGYTGYLIGDGYPVNGRQFGHGIQFPELAVADDFFLRTDFLPNRLFRFDGGLNAWVKVEDSVRMNMTNNDTRNTLKTGFINNTNYTYNSAIASDVVSLTEAETIVPTRILYTIGNTAPYVVIKSGAYQIEYAFSDYPNMYSSYLYTSPATGVTTTCLKITLPVISTVQQTIPATAQWTVTLYNTRDAQRSSLSTALKPRADL